MTRIITLLGALALAIIATAVWTGSGTTRNPQALAREVTQEVDTSGIVEMTLGNPDASVEVIEYASYTCPHCRSFHEGDFKKLKSEYIDTGKVRFIYREVYFDRFGLWASMIARCTGPDRFFGVTDLIYKGQPEWTSAGGGDPLAIVEELRKIGRLAGLSNDDLDACLQDGDKARALVAWYQQNAKADKVTSTPVFLINGSKYSNMPWDEFKAVLDDRHGSG